MQKDTTGNPYDFNPRTRLPFSVLVYSGKVVGVNKWKEPRAVRRGNKWKAILYEPVEYKSFKRDFALKAANDLPTFSGYVDIKITLWLWKMKDSDNPIKPIFDALELSGVIKNDRMIKNYSVERHYHKRAEQDMVLLEIADVSTAALELALIEQEKGYEVGK